MAQGNGSIWKAGCNVLEPSLYSVCAEVICSGKHLHVLLRTGGAGAKHIWRALEGVGSG